VEIAREPAAHEPIFVQREVRPVVLDRVDGEEGRRARLEQRARLVVGEIEQRRHGRRW
jgi:hypothetical protein